LSFAIIGIFLATVGASLGLDPATFRTAGAVILAIFGIILLVPKLQNVFAAATGALSNTGNEWLARVTFEGFSGQFLVLLGSLSRASLTKARGRLLNAGIVG
jgi:cytochrome c-type biogenesis protein